MKPRLTIDLLIREAENFCIQESNYDNPDLYGITDGKAVGTYIEHKFQELLQSKYDYMQGSSANGIDFPSGHVNTDIKVTSIKQPQSSCPFRTARQKIYGLGYNLLLLVYDKADDIANRVSRLNFLHCSFIKEHRTADYQTTRMLRQLIENDANADDIVAYLIDRNLPVDEITLNSLAREILENPPEQGCLTISNALQWRLQYSRIVKLAEAVEGIVPIVNKII